MKVEAGGVRVSAVPREAHGEMRFGGALVGEKRVSEDNPEATPSDGYFSEPRLAFNKTVVTRLVERPATDVPPKR
jgi:hypothetical protein